MQGARSSLVLFYLVASEWTKEDRLVCRYRSRHARPAAEGHTRPCSSDAIWRWLVCRPQRRGLGGDAFFPASEPPTESVRSRPAWGLVRGQPAVRPAAALGHREAPGRAVPCPPAPPSPFSPPPAPGGSGLQPELLRVPVAPCRGVGRLRCARWPRSGGRGPSEPVRNRHVIRLVTDTTQGAGKRERGPQSRATSSAVRRGRARRGALHPRLLQLGSPSATRSRRFGSLTFLPRHSIIVFPCR